MATITVRSRSAGSNKSRPRKRDEGASRVPASGATKKSRRQRDESEPGRRFAARSDSEAIIGIDGGWRRLIP